MTPSKVDNEGRGSFAPKSDSGCDACSLRTRQRFRSLSSDELAAVKAMRCGEQYLSQGQRFRAPAALKRAVFTLTEGWAFGYHVLPSGAHSIIDVFLPGDVIGLVPLLAGGAEYHAISLTPVRFCVLDGSVLVSEAGRLALSEPLMRLLAEQSRRWQIRASLLGMREPRQRLAYFLLDIFTRLRSVGIGDQTMCPFYLRRWHLAEAIGVSEVHLSRTLRQLQSAGLLDLASNVLVIPDPVRLQEATKITIATGENDQVIL